MNVLPLILITGITNATSATHTFNPSEKFSPVRQVPLEKWEACFVSCH